MFYSRFNLLFSNLGNYDSKKSNEEYIANSWSDIYKRNERLNFWTDDVLQANIWTGK